MASAARWEWRTFGEGADAGAQAIERLEPTGIQEGDERYLVRSGAATVKVRAGLVDIKQLLAVNEDGLEQWFPVLKEAFPLTAATLAAVRAALLLPDVPGSVDAGSEDELLAALTAPGSGVRDVPVHKRRVRYVVNGCAAELTTVTAAGIATRSLAVESTDAGAVVEGIRQLGLAGYVNVPYPEGLARLLEGVPARYAVIDCGTNSFKFHVAERAPDGSLVPVVDRAIVTRLGEGMEETGRIADAAAARGLEAIEGMVEEARALRATAIAAVGTAGMRLATNRDAFVDSVRARTHVTIEIIPGDDEARLAYLAAVAALGVPDTGVAVFDTGGGSTQLTFGHGSAIVDQFSIDVGAVRFTERFGLDRAVPADRVAEALDAIDAELGRLARHDPVSLVIGMGGAMTNLAAVELGLERYDADAVQGLVLGRDRVVAQAERYRQLDAEERRSITGLQPARAEVILAGACVVLAITRRLGASSVRVSDRGLRHGVLAMRFGILRGEQEVRA